MSMTETGGMSGNPLRTKHQNYVAKWGKAIGRW